MISQANRKQTKMVRILMFPTPNREWGYYRKWYEAGYCGKAYIPYSLLDGDKLVANVSVSIMKINIF